MENLSIPNRIYLIFVISYISVCTLIGCAYLFMTTFMVIPEENIRLADTYGGFFMGTFITSCLAFVVGGSLMIHGKKSEPHPALPGTTEVDLTVKTTPEPIKETKDEKEEV